MDECNYVCMEAMYPFRGTNFWWSSTSLSVCFTSSLRFARSTNKRFVLNSAPFIAATATLAASRLANETNPYPEEVAIERVQLQAIVGLFNRDKLRC